MFSFSVILPFVIIPLYAVSLGATLFQTSLIIGIFWGTQSVTTVIMGALSDILGKRKPFIIFSLFGAAVIFLFISFISLPVVLILLMGLFGFVTAAFSPCVMGAVSELSSEAERGKSLGILNTSTSLGWAIGSVLSGLITDIFSFLITFYVGCFLAILAGILTLIFFKEIKIDRTKDRDFRTIFTTLKNQFLPGSGESTYLKQNGLNWFLVSMFLRYSAYWGSIALLTIFFATLVSTSWIGILLGINMGLQGFLMAPIGKLSDKIGRKPLITFGLIGTSIVLVLYAIAYDLYLLIATQLLLAVVFASIYTGGSAFVSDVTPKFKHNEAMGFLNSSITVGAVTGTILAGILAELFGLREMFWILAILPLLGTVIVLRKVRETIISF
jgi:MFS family permease